MSTMLSDIKEIKKAISMLALEFPFSMPFIKYDIVFNKPTVDTAAIDGVRLYICKKYYDSLDRFERNGLLLHEWWHVAKLDNSAKRVGFRNHTIWNHASDFWINLVIYKDSLSQQNCIKVPRGFLVDTSFDGMTTEQIYDELVFLMNQRKNGDSSGDNSNNAHNTADTNKYADKYRSADMLNKTISSEGYFCNDLLKQPIDYDEDSIMKDVLTGLGLQQKSRGSLPGHYQMLLNFIKESKADWRSILNSLFKQVKYFGGARSFSNPKKWGWCYNVCLPGEIGKKKVSVTIVIDVSGSMLVNDTLARIAGEVSRIIPLSYDCTVITADTEIKQTVKVKDLKEFVRKFNKSKGGGGTNFVPALKECEKLSSDVTLFFTDGYGEFGDKIPRIKNLMWVLTERGVKPPFGRYINID